MMAVLMLVLGLCLGMLLATAAYTSELRRLARFLCMHEPHSNARATSGTGAPGVRDLAEAINAELDRTSQERIEAQRHQDEFQRDLSALSHDIRTPLTGAKGYLQLARDEADAAARARDLEAAAARIDSTTALLDELFAYTKSADPDLALDLQEVALQPLIERVLVGHYPAFEERGWEPELHMSNDPDARPLAVHADPDALARILENLVTNAIRHGSGAPRIRVERHPAASGPAPTNLAAADAAVMSATPASPTAGYEVAGTAATGSAPRFIEITVENPVPANDAIDVSRLFDRFYQADTARHAAGSGLGLAVSANLARAMGMKLTAQLHDDAAPRALAITLACPL